MNEDAVERHRRLLREQAARERELADRQWEHTVISEGRLDDDLTCENGIRYFRGFRLIERDSPIEGGVSIGRSHREALLVDWSYGALPALDDMITAELAPLRAGGRTPGFNRVLAEIYDRVYQTIRPDKEGVSRLLLYACPSQDTIIPLDTFINRGIGVCRHMALACAALVERRLLRNELQGHVSYDRAGGHGWCRYTASDGTVWILDVSKRFFGTLAGAAKSSKIYCRPEES